MSLLSSMADFVPRDRQLQKVYYFSETLPLILKKTGSSFHYLKHKAKKTSAAAILLGPKELRVLVRSQCEITRRGLSNASLRILEVHEGMYSTHLLFMVYIPPISNKLDRTKNLGSRTIGSSIQSFLRSVDSTFFKAADPSGLILCACASSPLRVSAVSKRRFVSSALHLTHPHCSILWLKGDIPLK